MKRAYVDEPIQDAEIVSAELPEYIVGIDMSVRSPAVCIYHCAKHTFHIYAWDKKRAGTMVLHNGHTTLNICVFPERVDMDVDGDAAGNRSRDTSLMPDVERRSRRNRAVVRRVIQAAVEHAHVPAWGEERLVHVVMEGYAYSKHSSSTSVLCELGGCLREQIWTHTHWRMYEWTPSHVKKAFTGRGNANKADMCHRMNQVWQTMCFDDVTNPWNDMVDAYAVVMTHLKTIETAAVPLMTPVVMKSSSSLTMTTTKKKTKKKKKSSSSSSSPPKAIMKKKGVEMPPSFL